MSAGGGIPFGQYTLLRRIARGGMAEVFLAKQRGLEGFDRRVAVKRILPHLADSREFLKMFLEEARLAASLNHPNIVHIYEFGKNGDDYFIAMEFVDGVHAGQIAAITAGRPMPWGLLARIGADAASALHFAHQITDENGRRLGLVHRDISPANILVSYSGSAKIVDFGIAKAVEISDQRTNPGTVKGKFTYMSPEQTTGAQLDGRSDVFSLAIVLWELATGRPLVDRGDPGAAMRAIRDGKFPAVETIVPTIPTPLSQALAWAMEVDRDRRATAADLAQALEAYVKASPELATAMQLGAWISRELPPSHSSDDDDDDDDIVGNVAPRANPEHTVAGPRTMAGPPTGAVSVADAMRVLRAGPSSETRQGPLAGIPGSPQRHDDDDDDPAHFTFAELPTSPKPLRKRPSVVPPTAMAPAAPTAELSKRHTGDLSEEMARTGVFQPNDPAEFDDTVERRREDGDAPMQRGSRRLPGMPIDAKRPQALAQAPAVVAPMRRGQSSVPPPFRSSTTGPARSYDPAPVIAPVAPTIQLALPQERPSERPPDLFAERPSERASERRLPRALRPRRWPWVAAGVAAAVFGVLLARACGNSDKNSKSAPDATLAVDAAPPLRLPLPVDAAPAVPRDAAPNPTHTLLRPDAANDMPPTSPDVAVIEVTSEPSSAQVMLGDRTSTTPARFETQGGQQLLVLELPGFERYEQPIVPVLGEVTRLTIPLKPLSSDGVAVGRVALRATPASEVFEGRRNLGRTPLNIDLALGTHTLVFRAAGHQAATKTIRVKATGNAPVSVKLRK
jgi:serine/threonine protein kinase